MAALGASESSQGQNLGSLGNIFQVLPSTAANPGYGLSGVNGNDPFSVAAYVSALLKKAGGNLQQAIGAYQGGGAPNTAMASFLTSQGYSVPSAGNTMIVQGGAGVGGGTGVGGTAGAAGAVSPSTSPATWLSSVSAWAGQYASRGVLIVLAILLILGALYLFASRTQQVATHAG
jgi:hypothetical protein